MRLRFVSRAGGSRLRRIATAAGLVVTVLSLGGFEHNASAGLADYSGTLYLSATASAAITSTTSYQLTPSVSGAASTATKNRIPCSGGLCTAGVTVGYQNFSPGFQPVTTAANTPTSTVSASTTPNGKGWIVDNPGAVSFAAGTWTFTNRISQTWNGTGFATLAVGMWKVKVSSGAISSSTLLIDPNCSASPCGSGAAPGAQSPGTSFITSAGSVVQISLPVSLSSFSLANGEHLYVQYWRWQTVAMPSSAGAANRVATFYANDGTSSITHPAATALPNTPTLGSIAARVNTTPTLSASYSDPAGDTGTLSFQLCSDSACTAVLQSGSSASGLADGATGTWTPSTLADGTYYWRSQARDPAGDLSAWSGTSSFVMDTTPATTPTLNSPSAAARVGSTQVNATFNDPDVGDTGTISFQLCSDSACSSVVSSSTSATVANGTSASWTPGGVADGTYYWRVRGQDLVGNAPSAWSSTQSFTLDTTAPSTPSLGSVAALVNAIPQLSATFSDPDAGDSGTISFQLCSDSACSSVVSSSTSAAVANGASANWTPSSLSDGTYYWRASAKDSVGNQSPWSATASFKLDTTAPAVPTLAAVAARTNVTPQLSTTFSDPDASDTGTLSFQLCSSSSCTSVLQSSTSASGIVNGAGANWTPSHLADATYYWRARALDAAGNASAWSAASSFVVDTVAPTAPTLVSPASAARVDTTQVSATFSDPDVGDSGAVSFQLCSDSACSSVVSSSTSATVANGTSASWTPGSVSDGTYYWRARSQDAAGNQSAWSSPRSLVLDTTAPSVPALGSVTALVKAMPSLSATLSDPDAGDTGTLSFQLCTDSTCSAVVDSHTGSVVANGASDSWTPSSHPDGTFYWRASGKDTAGNQSAWSAAGSFKLDTTPPTAPALGAVAARTNVTPQLAATFSDPDAGDTGTLSFQLCSSSSCTSVLQNSTSAIGIANGAAANWTPSHLADGTYYWRASATDAAGNASAWSAASSFVVDTVAPSAPTLVSPSTSARLNAVRVSATFSDSDAGDSGTLTFQLCSDSACSSVVSSSTSASLADGASASWAPSGLGDGVYYWRASATDAAGNQSAWSTARSLTLDTVAPGTPALGSPADGVDLNAIPTLSATFSDADAGDTGALTFQVCADSACASVVQTGSSASGLATGGTGSWNPSGLSGASFYWRANATDAAGNTSTWSATRRFALDQTPPAVPALGTISARTSTTPQLSTTFSDPDASDTGTLSLQLCANATCTSVLQSATSGNGIGNGASWSWTPAPLSEGTYYVRASASDAAGNVSGWSATGSFIVDRRAPVPTLVALTHSRVNAAPLLSVRIDDPNDPTDVAQAIIDVCADPACARILATGSSGIVPVGATASWQAPSLPDGVYYWHALAKDELDNESAPTSTQQFVVDTTAPSAPGELAPSAGSLVAEARLTATFAGSDPSETGRLAFEVCTHADCTNVVARGLSASVASGESASWAPGTLADGSYFWRAQAVDEAGNSSDWSATRSFTLDATPPGPPRQVSAKVSGLIVSLRWRPPSNSPSLAGYILLIDGHRARLLDPKTFSVKLSLRRTDKRTFAIVAVDKAGNLGTPLIISAPNLIRKAVKAVRAGTPPRPHH